MRDSAKGAGDSLTKLRASGAKELDRVASGARALTDRVKGAAAPLKSLAPVFDSVRASASRAFDKMNAAKLNTNLKAEQDNLRRLKSAMSNLNLGSSVDLAAARKLQTEIKASQEKVAQLQGRLVAAGAAGQKFNTASKDSSRFLGLAKAGAVAAAASVALIGAASLKAGSDFIQFGTRMALGPIGLERMQMASQKAQLNIRRLFLGIDSTPLVRAANRAADFFNKSNVSGQMLSKAFHSGFGALFSLVEKAVPYVENFALGAVYGALLIENAWLRAQIPLVPLTVKLEKLLGNVDWMEVAFTVGTAAAIGFAASAVLVGASLLFAASPVIILGAAIYFAIDAVSSLVDWFKNLVGAGDEAAKAATGVADRFRSVASSLGGAKGAANDNGKAIGDGLVSGMLSKVAEVTSAGAQLAKAADAGVRAEAQIRSPSRKMKTNAGFMVQGAVSGFQEGAPRVQEAAAKALVPDTGSAPRRGAMGQGGAPQATAATAPVQIVNNFYGVAADQQGVANIEAAVERVARRVFGDTAVEMGLTTEAA
ncbi:hypothetical protein BE21_57505 [Sorangium cellulosum]|uniref:Uncharacterized protein n=1 Tax=Sorangium cellulosum TaxID=56 RepID=A0A150U381_SORCE|nr:hypothetical protein BE21_57505 [Sorangium cellulosum]